MPPSQNPEAVSYAREYMDRALQSERGIRLQFPTKEACIKVRADCYWARKLDRAMSRKIHPEDSEDYGKSQYDNLRLSVKTEDGKHWLHFEPQSLTPLSELKVEDL